VSCDLLVLAPHPDDAELHCGGTIARHVRLGARVVVVDATRGELSTRGSLELRAEETEAASAELGLSARENLELADGALQSDDLDARRRVVDALRRHRPQALLAIAETARHPDHRALGRLSRSAVKAAALHRFSTASGTEAHAGARLWHYEAELPLQPDLLVPCSEADWERKMAAVRCYRSQFGLDAASGPATSIADPAFLRWIEDRGRCWGYHAGAPYAEALLAPETPVIGDLRGV